MNTIKAFIKTKEGKRALWTIFNSLTAVLLGYLTYMASQNVAWAITVVPVATAFSQFITKAINTPN